MPLIDINQDCKVNCVILVVRFSVHKFIPSFSLPKGGESDVFN